AQRYRETPSILSGQETLFVSLWSLSIPLVVTGATRRMQCAWTPEEFIISHGHERVKMIKMVDPATVSVSVTVAQFFDEFCREDAMRPYAVKVKDWPPSSLFEAQFKRHFDAFMDAVPFPSYTRYNGFRNLAAHWPDTSGKANLKPDLGPKMYVATRDLNERGSTPLHLDVTGAVNILVHSSAKDRDVPGALWHIYRAEDSDAIRTYLRTKGLYTVREDPIHARQTYLTSSMRLELRKLDVVAFEVHQKVGDAVFIPAGCAHQVSNLHSCIKVACDFLCPEGIVLSSKISEEFRRWSMPDVLQLRSMLWHGWTSLSLQSPVQANERTRIQRKRQRTRATSGAQADSARRKKQKRHHDGNTSAASHEHDYKCPHEICSGRDKSFKQLNGVFNHL
ncbi:hypothetical protein LXA43DRAFT_902649, partial [Ganoderma leucocontextum]